MSNQINDGGLAFPLGPTASTMKPHADGGGHMIVTHYGMEPGMTLRDYFAAAALQGMNIDGKFSAKTYAQDAYRMADAMLKAREAKL